MPPQPTQIPPTQVPQGPVNPVMMALLKARAAQGAQGGQVGPAPNGLPIGGAPAPMPAPAAGAAPMAPRPGGASPTQQIMKAATPAQSPLMDEQTRGIAKSLIQKLMQHM